LQLLSSAVGRYGTESVRKWHVATLAICQLSRLVLTTPLRGEGRRMPWRYPPALPVARRSGVGTLHRVGPLAQETSMKMTRRKLLI